MEKNPNLLTGIEFGNKIIAHSEKLDGEKEQEERAVIITIYEIDHRVTMLELLQSLNLN